MGTLTIGVARVDYAPRVGLPLLGHFRDDYSSTGVHDPLYAKAMVLTNARGQAAALLTLDICMVTRDQVKMMREHIAGRTNISPDHILIAATHIHSGPSAGDVYNAMPSSPAADLEAFLTRAAEAVVQAWSTRTAARLAIGSSREDRISFYRRLWSRDGRVHMNFEEHPAGFFQKPAGEIDPEVVALTVETQDRSVAGLVNFALHPAILDYENTLYSAEYPGYLAEAMRKIVGEEFETLFFNGCCGNINHIDYQDPAAPRRGYVAAQRVGYMLAAAVKDAMRRSTDGVGDRIEVSSERVPLARMRIDEETYRRSKQAVEEQGLNAAVVVKDGLPLDHTAPIWVAMHDRQDQPDAAEVMAIRIGDLGIVGLPGEVFVEFGRKIKQESPARHTLVIELANDSIGYLPTPEAFDQGGYEITPGATQYEKDAGQRLTASALKQLNQLFQD